MKSWAMVGNISVKREAPLRLTEKGFTKEHRSKSG